MEFTPSKYQEEIFKEIIDISVSPKQSRNVVVVAAAGTGKTKTIEEGTKLIPQNFKILFMAYNKHIADNFIPRATKNTTVSTCHKYGYIGVIRRMSQNGRKPEVDAYKVHNLAQQILENDYMELGQEESRNLKPVIVKIVSLLKSSLLPVNKESVESLIEEYQIETSSDINIITQICAKIMMKCSQVFGSTDSCTIDYDDMIWLPIYHNLPLQQYDFVFVDETQDLNPAQFELVFRAVKSLGSIIAVGDPNQAIYGFRGADTEAMENMITRAKAKVLPLSICYRCPTSHIELAQKYVPEIEPSPYKGVGTVRNIKESELQNYVQKGDLVICRYNAPLVKPCFQLIRSGIKSTIRGREIGTNLIAKVRKTKGTKIQEFLSNLKKDMLKEKSNLESMGKSIEATMDRYETLCVLSEDCEDTNCLIQKIETIFSDNESAVVFSSCHKAKGLEANSVHILKPSLMPSQYSKTAKQDKQEKNLQYISVTRAKETLTFIE